LKDDALMQAGGHSLGLRDADQRSSRRRFPLFGASCAGVV